MSAPDLFDYLKERSYPGRGIFFGRTQNGAAGLLAYFLMGRSSNSQNRILVPEGDDLRTRPFDPAKLEDPSLILYAPVRVLGASTIVTNGDQTDTLYEFLARGGTFEEALATRTYEPDPPAHTPRISGVFDAAGGRTAYRLSILKADPIAPQSVQRQYFHYDPALPGQGHLLHTYNGPADPLPSFAGEPAAFAVDDRFEDPADLAGRLWDSLDPNYRVALFLRRIDLATGAAVSVICNRHDAGETSEVR